MHKKILSLLLTAVILLAPVSPVILPARAAPPGEYITVIVELHGDTAADLCGDGGLAAFLAGGGAGADYIRAYRGILDSFTAAAELLAGDNTVRTLGGALFRGAEVTVRADLLWMLAAMDIVKSIKPAREFEQLDFDYDGIITNSTGDYADAVNIMEENRPRTGDSAARQSPAAGSGVVVAVIDTGFDVDHPAFTLPDNSAVKIAPGDIAGLLPLLSAYNTFGYPGMDPAELYKSEKIPFAYNYYDRSPDVRGSNPHGTHVAGLIAANSHAPGETGGVPAAAPGDSYSVPAAAPGSQLILLKIFSDDGESILSEYALLCAYEDAVLLGADVINLSLGSPADYAYGTTSFSLDRAIEESAGLGIVTVCAGGNEGRTGAGSRFDSGGRGDAGGRFTYPLAANPDSGLVSGPSSYHAALSVAASENYYSVSRYLLAAGSGGDHKIRFTDTSSQYLPDRRGFRSVFDGMTLEYVPAGGVGGGDDYAAADVSGKLALVKRGAISFAEKAAFAAGAGAVGLIVYDDTPGGELIEMALDGAEIPAVFISNADGLKLRDADDRRIYISAGHSDLTENPRGGLMSGFSSWGCTPSLTLKPEITAGGGEAYSTVPGGEYALMSGTSMAAPQVSGHAAALIARLRDDGAAVIAEGGYALSEYIRARLMYTAELIPAGGVGTNPDNGNSWNAETGGDSLLPLMYSPRRQGAGLINLPSLLEAQSSLTSGNGSGKAELFDNLGDNFKLTVLVTNESAIPRAYGMSAVLQGDGYVTLAVDDRYENFITEQPAALSGAVITAEILEISGGTAGGIPGDKAAVGAVNINAYAGDKTLGFSLGGGGSALIELTFAAGKTAADLAEIFTSGYFLEGFILLNDKIDAGAIDDGLIDGITQEYGTDSMILSIPYLGFSGDWNSLPIFDGYDYDGRASFYGDNRVMGLAGDGMVESGVNLYAPESESRTELIAFSPASDGILDALYVNIRTFRRVYYYDIKVYNESGEIVAVTDNGYYMQKTFMYYGQLTDGIYCLWNGRDVRQYSYIYPDGQYYVTISAYGDDGQLLDKVTLPVFLDNEKPKLLEYMITQSDGRTYLETTASDNHMLQFASLYIPKTGVWNDGGNQFESIIIPGISEDLLSGGSDVILNEGKSNETYVLRFDITDYTGQYLYLDLIDYALNSTTQKINLQ